MGEVKHYGARSMDLHTWENDRCNEYHCERVVRASDYNALRTERDRLVEKNAELSRLLNEQTNKALVGLTSLAGERERIAAQYDVAMERAASLEAICDTRHAHVVRLERERDRMREALEGWSHEKVLLDSGELVPCGCVLCEDTRAALKSEAL
jgi:hypothetical protein